MKKKTSKKSSKKEEKMEKGQIWSIDVIIGILIFIAVLIIFYVTLNEGTDDNVAQLKENADTVILKFSQDVNLKLLDEDNNLNYTKLEQLSNMTYEVLKEALGISGDFCIYIEDEEGRIVPIGTKTSIGKGDVNLSGSPCGSAVS